MKNVFLFLFSLLYYVVYGKLIKYKNLKVCLVIVFKNNFKKYF